MPMSVAAAFAIVLLVALALLAAETWARARVRSEIVRSVADLLGAAPTVAFGPRLALVPLARHRRIPALHLETRHAANDPRVLVLTAAATDVVPGRDAVTVGSLTATAELRLSWMRHLVESAREKPGDAAIVVRTLTLLPHRRSVAVTVGLPVAFGLGVDVRVVVAVSLRDGRIALRATDLSMPVSVVPVPIPIAWAINSWITALRARIVPPAVDALTITDLRWSEDAVVVDLTAHEATVPLGG
ncbi:hypothetical protein FK529_07070 [Tsukamurella asaccharolytica]|uniref:DUF2993 domain-containing protein n=1 Tax=Tsukamurella asaccharolytica TaxID=2592067 RepID=A0A5C5RBL8_9ACTN|nr:hypothetical protein [Tsukamurella asaccharolytica]TWS19904.1 hypothetical protein FK529_07070 [Tsukamurella asaccharolytica]